MLRWGITDLAGLARAVAAGHEVRDLAAPVLWEAWQTDPARYGPVCLAAFQRLRMGNGVYKYTAPHRFDDIHVELTAAIRAALDPVGVLRVHDLGVSDGTTSVEFVADLRGAGFEVDITMSDWYDALYVVRFAGSPWTAVLDADLTLIQFYGRGCVIGILVPPGWRTPIKRLVHARVLPSLRARVDKVVATWNRDLKQPPPGVSIERVPLIASACVSLVKNSHNARFVRHDVRAPLDGPYRLVRAVNVLNPGYFAPEVLKGAIGQIHAALAEGGLFIVGRSIDEQDGRTTATLYRRRGAGLELLRRWNGGSELEPLVAAAAPPAASR